MATTLNKGAVTWSLTRDIEGWREYKVILQVQSNNSYDGPYTVAYTPGLPVLGTPWIIDNDVDIWVWCRAGPLTIKPHPSYASTPGEPVFFWYLEYTFSNKPIDRKHQRCQDNETQDPLLEPYKITGGTSRYTEEATFDRFGNKIYNSAFEQIRGSQVEFDAHRSQIVIEQNVPNLQLALCQSMVDTLNPYVLWDSPYRSIKLSDFKWERLFYLSCELYYKRTFTFEIRTRYDMKTQQIVGDWDRDILDEGTKALNGHWGDPIGTKNILGPLVPDETYNWILDKIGDQVPDGGNPSHYAEYKDRHGNKGKCVLGIDPTTKNRGIPVGGKLQGPITNVSTNQVGSAVVTSPSHGLQGNPHLAISQVIMSTPSWGFNSPNGTYMISVVDQDNFILINCKIPIGDFYASGGYWENLDAVQPNMIHIEKYDMSDFLQLAIPVVLDTSGQ